MITNKLFAPEMLEEFTREITRLLSVSTEAVRDQAIAALNVNTQAWYTVAAMPPSTLDRYRKLVVDLAGVAQRDVAQTQAQVRTLPPGQVLLHPTPQGYLEAEMAGNPAGLLKLASTGANLNMRGSEGPLCSGITGRKRVQIR